MTGPYRFPIELRHSITNALPEQGSQFGQKPLLQYMYVPRAHAKALHPDNMLVVGIRGAGKSFWWTALQEQDHRGLVGELSPGVPIGRTTRVSQGFGERPSPDAYPGKDTLRDLLSRRLPARDIWRTVILCHIAKQQATGTSLLENADWKDRVGWTRANPGQVERLAFEEDRNLDREGVHHLILFDALDRAADDWDTMRQLVKGLLQVLLEFRPYKRIRPKAFLRPDHLESPLVAEFPDSSKVLSSKVELTWPRIELYGLLWQHLGNETQSGDVFRNGCGVEWKQREGVWTVPESLRSDESTQREVFHAIAGLWMGRDRRRGFPYTWLPNHLGDARRQVSPRSFLAALRHAADGPPRQGWNHPLHFEDIKRGVQEASKIRVKEMQEDYPWVARLMDALRGITVPCEFAVIEERWRGGEVWDQLEKDITAGNVKLPPALAGFGPAGVRQDLEVLGVFERMSDDRVNLPDVYRVGYGIGRRGGVKLVT